ncbi:MAG: REP-associated tyrosine transposase [Terriglobales bacterium]
MPSGLKRYYGGHDLHFITCSSYRRRPLLGTAGRRDLLLKLLDEVRRRHRFVVLGYVIMPEHFHLLISEPQVTTPSVVMQVLKQRFAHQLLNRQRRARPAGQLSWWPQAAGEIWQRRFYDFNVWTERKRIEKLRYMHRNPVKRGLVSQPEQWAWSSFRFYALGEAGRVRINDCDVLEMKIQPPAAGEKLSAPTLSHRTRKGRAPSNFPFDQNLLL